MKKWWVTALVLGAVCLLLFCVGGDFPFEAGFQLVCGWALFLYRVVPQIRVDPAAFVVALVCLTGLAVGLHLFFRWLYVKIKEAKSAEPAAVSRWRVRWTGMILALVVLTFVAGISAVGITHQTAWLYRSGQLFRRSGGIREAAARMSSANNLKQIGNALHDHEGGNGALPPGGTFDAQGNALHGWQTLLLPYIEQDNLYKTIDLKTPWNDPKNERCFRTVVFTYLHPAGGEMYDDAGIALSHYAANVRLLGAGAPRTLKSITDGTSNTIMAGEVWAAYKPWGHPVNWRDPARGIHTTPDSFGSPMRSDSVQFLMADGSVRTVNKSVSLTTLKALSTPDGGEELGNDW